MDRRDLTEVLEKVHRGELPVEEAAERLEGLSFAELGYATVDHHRHLRHGFPEVIFAQGKTVEQISGILDELKKGGGNILVTRIGEPEASAVARNLPDVTIHPEARAITLKQRPHKDRGRGPILVVCAGTSDLPVANEAVLTARMMDNQVELIADVGVAGIHRLLDKRERLEKASVIIVVAGMEGALASVVGGLVAKPVVAVPTSVGYGAAFGGLTALLAMLNSCASGVTVVNIDNGFGAGYAAALMNRKH